VERPVQMIEMANCPENLKEDLIDTYLYEEFYCTSVVLRVLLYSFYHLLQQ